VAATPKFATLPGRSRRRRAWGVVRELHRRPLALGSSGDGGLGIKPHPAAFAERGMRHRVEKMQLNQKEKSS